MAMYPKPRHPIRNCCTGIMVILAIALPSFAQEPLRYISEHDNKLFQADAARAVLREVEYVSLSDVIDQFGGAINVLPTRTRIDLLNTTAFVKADDRRVSALSIFSLQHPILEENQSLWIAEIDVVPFFLKSFRMELKKDLSVRVDTPPLDTAPVLEGTAPSVSEPSLPQLTNREAMQFPRNASPTSSITPVVEIKTILIDAGHGGTDAGIQSPTGLSEKDLTLAVANQLAANLEDRLEQTVVMSRQDDLALTGGQRARMMQNLPETFVLAVHAASEPSGAWHGMGVYRHAGGAVVRGMSRQDGPALKAQSEIAERLRAAFPDQTIHTAELPLQLFAASERPGLVIEVGFLSNPEEAEQLSDPGHQKKIADAIAEGLIAALTGNASVSLMENIR